MTMTGRMPGAAAILIGAAVMMTLTMGLRQSLGIFMQPAVEEIAITVAEFTFAVAVQNLLWGLFQPFAGAAAVRWGYRPVMMFGAVVYAGGMLVLSQAEGMLAVLLGAGLCIGTGMACASVAMAMAVTARTVSAARRSTMLGVMSAAGSIGTLIAAPIGQFLQDADGWRLGVLGFALMAALIVPAAWLAGRTDRRAEPTGAQAGPVGDREWGHTWRPLGQGEVGYQDLFGLLQREHVGDLFLEVATHFRDETLPEEEQGTAAMTLNFSQLRGIMAALPSPDSSEGRQ